jgi:cobalamin biosynthesis protein CobT
MAKRTLNRRDLRADFDAAERRKKEEEAEDEDEEEEDEEEAEASDEEEEEGEEGEEGEEEAAVKKKKKKVAAPKPAKPKRTRTPKIVRQRVIWVVYNNSHQPVASFDYPKKAEAEEHAKKLMTDKKQTFFVQPVKENIEEKK